MWLTLAIWGVTLAASWAYNKWGREEPKKPESRLLELAGNLPRTDEGTPIPLVFGRVRVNRALVVWYSPPQNVWADNPPRWRYAIDMLFVVGIPMKFGAPTFDGLGNRTHSREPKLWNMYIGDQTEVWTTTAWVPVTHEREAVVVVDQGGPGAGGQIVGSLHWYNGSPDQTLSNNLANFSVGPDPDTYLFPAVSDITEIANSMQFHEEDGTLIPGYRDQMLVSLTTAGNNYGAGIGGLTEGFEIPESGSIPPFGFEVSTYGADRYSVAGFNGLGDDADPIEVIHEILESDWGKVGYPSAAIDAVSFQAASDVLCAEGNGYSRVHYDTEDAKQVIQGILKQMNAVMYEEPSNGKLTLKLVRPDYNPATIPQFGDGGAGIVECEDYAIGNYGDTYNEVHVTYTSRAVGYLPRIARAYDAGNSVQAVGGRKRVHTVDYPGCCTEELASALAGRDLAAMSRPLAKGRFVFDRRADGVRPGDVIRITSFAQHHIVNLVFRVMNMDRGDLFDGRITLDLIQDPFGTATAGVDPGDVEPLFLFPGPLTHRVFDEAPRLLIRQAIAAGKITGNADDQRVMMCASQEDSFSEMGIVPLRWQGETQDQKADWSPGSIALDPFAVDVKQRGFQRKGTLAADYSRARVPYDTTSTMTVDMFRFTDLPAVPSGSIETAIRNSAVQLMLVGNELMAYEDWSEVVPGQLALYNVWRGLLDTVEDDHVAGEEVWFLDLDNIGRVGWSSGSLNPRQLIGHAVPRAHYKLGSGQEADDLITLRTRTLLPQRPHNMQLSVKEAGIDATGTTTITGTAPDYCELSFLDGGFDVEAMRRDRYSAQVQRGDGADQPMTEAGGFYYITARRVGETDETLIFQYPDQALTGPHAFWIPTHGLIDVLVDARREIQPGDPSGSGSGWDPAEGNNPADVITAWQKARVRVNAPRWRNLVTDPRFSYNTFGLVAGGVDLGGWRTSGGSPAIISDASSLRRTGTGTNKGYYCRPSATANPTFTRMGVEGWRSRGMSIVCWYYRRNPVGETNDTTRVTLEAQDAVGAVLASAASALSAGGTANWSRAAAVSLTVPAGTMKLGVTLDGAEVAGGGTGIPEGWIGDVHVVMGQLAFDVLTNPSYELGAGSWTVSAGAIVLANTIASPSGQYAQGGANASNVWYQDYTIPVGFHFGTFVLRSWRAQTLANDSGQIDLLVLDGGGATIASATTGAEQFNSNLNEWFPRVLAVDLPDNGTAVTIRVRCTAVRSLGAGNSGACFDDHILMPVNQLLPTTVSDALFSTPVEQKAPTTWQAAHLAWPTYPRCQVFSGDAFAPGGNLGFQWTDGSTTTPGARITGAFGGGVCALDAYDFIRASGTLSKHIVAGTNVYGRFGRARGSVNGFTIVVFFASTEGTTYSGACGLVGRMIGTRGYGLGLNASGEPVVKMRGDGGNVSATRAGRAANVGGFRMAAITWDPATDQLHVDDDAGRTSVSTAAIGEFYTNDVNALFRIGIDETANNSFGGSIARVYRFVRPLTQPQIAAMHTYGTDPTGGLWFSSTRAEPAWLPGGDDVDGETLYLAETQVIPLGWTTGLEAFDDADEGEGYGLATSRLATNLIPSFDLTDSLYWQANNATLTQRFEDATGRLRGAAATIAAGTGGIRLQGVTVTATATIRLIVYLRKTSAGGSNVNVILRNGVGVVKQTVAIGALPSTWKRYEINFTAWDGSTASCQFSFEVTGAQAFAISHVLFAYQGTAAADTPAVWHRDAAGAMSAHTTHQLAVSMPVQFNTEGEMIVEGVGTVAVPVAGGALVSSNNGATNANRRDLFVSTTLPSLNHWDSTPANNTSSGTAVASYLNPWQVRGRWRRAMLLDNAVNPFAGVISDNFGGGGGASYGRTAVWTPSAVVNGKAEVGIAAAIAVPWCGYLRRVKLQACEEKLA